MTAVTIRANYRSDARVTRASSAEGEGLGKRFTVTLALLALACANSAQAREPVRWMAPVPWVAQSPQVTPFEASATRVARSIAGSPVFIKCVDATWWRVLGDSLGFDPMLSWAVTPFSWDSELLRAAPDGMTYFSPRACRFGMSFWLDSPEQVAGDCRAYLQRARDSGTSAQRGRASCDEWALMLTAVHVLTHEAVHLYGFYDEALTDCFAIQIQAWVAVQLGANETFARSSAREYWTDFFLPRAGMYQSAECHDRGRLDLFPARSGWPTPLSYPTHLDASLSAFETELGAAGTPP